MNIKGKATIQLLDIDNNIVREVVEENLITNAVDRIVTLAGKDFVKGSYATGSNLSYYHLSQVTPLATQLFGGLLLFQDTIDEDPNIVIPPVGSKPIGNAGAPYSGTSPYRGTYNETESGTLFSGVNPIGYRHVWDFGTDKANGTISCMCLTSKAGGNTGWKSRGLFFNANNEMLDPDTLLEIGFCPSVGLPYKTFSSFVHRRDIPIISKGFSNSVQGRLIHVDEAKGDLYFALPYSSTTPGMIVKSSFPLSRELSIFDDIGYHLGPEYVPYITMGHNKFNYKGYFEFDQATGNVKYLYVSSSTSLTEDVYGSTGTRVSSKRISIEGSGSLLNEYFAIHPFIYRGYYYAQTTANNLIKISSSGDILATYDISAITGYEFVPHYSQILDRIILKRASSSSGVPGVAILFDGETFETFRTGETNSTLYSPASCSSPVAPGTYMTATPTSSWEDKMVHYAFYSNYLATINNLAEPIIKTSATTMKVTYDLYVE